MMVRANILIGGIEVGRGAEHPERRRILETFEKREEYRKIHYFRMFQKK